MKKKKINKNIKKNSVLDKFFLNVRVEFFDGIRGLSGNKPEGWFEDNWSRYFDPWTIGKSITLIDHDLLILQGSWSTQKKLD